MNFLAKLIKSRLRNRFILPISALLVASTFVISGYLLQRQSEGFRRELETSGETMIRMLAINAESGVLFESEYVLDELLQVLTPFESVECALVSNADGLILSSTDKNEPPIILHSDGHLHVDNNDIHKEYIINEEGEELLMLTTSVVTRKGTISRESLGITGQVPTDELDKQQTEVIGHITICLSLEYVNQAISEGRLAVIILALFVLVVGIIIIAIIVNAVTKPITELVEVTDQVRQGDFSRKAGMDRTDELGHLARTFNLMIDSLQQSRDEIEKYNRTLEEKIIQRTEQLEDAQAQLVQSEKLSAIGQLAAGVAHELNNPLGGILGYAQFTIEKLRKNNPKKTTSKEINSYLKYVGDIEAQARRCKTIVQNLLKFSRSSRSVDFEDVDLNKVIKETITFVEHQLKINQIEIECTFTENLETVQGNYGQLQQVFTNLIINAMHASESGQTIRVQSRFSPPVGEFSGAVEILFIDEGHGVAPENMKKIFEPFFTTKEIGKGTGLGLSVSYGIIRDHGGEIQISSELGQGTTFTIVLPVQKNSPTADKQKIISEST